MFYPIISKHLGKRQEMKELRFEVLKELSFCHKLRFSNSYNLATRFINSVRSNSLSLKYQRFTPTVCKDIYGLENVSLLQNSVSL